MLLKARPAVLMTSYCTRDFVKGTKERVSDREALYDRSCPDFAAIVGLYIPVSTNQVPSIHVEYSAGAAPATIRSLARFLARNPAVQNSRNPTHRHS